jgi:hypothetical protein
MVERKPPLAKFVRREHQREGYKKSSRWMLFKQILEREIKERKNDV